MSAAEKVLQAYRVEPEHNLSAVPDTLDFFIETPEGIWMIPTECPDLREKHLSCALLFSHYSVGPSRPAYIRRYIA